jgi:hypothetical protein
VGAPRLSGPRATPGGRLATGEAARARRPGAAAAARYPLPLAKLRGVPSQARAALKVGRITTCDQLLAAAAVAEDREALARATKIAPEILADLVRRADMARVDGVGAVFGLMLEELGIRDVQGLAN